MTSARPEWSSSCPAWKAPSSTPSSHPRKSRKRPSPNPPRLRKQGPRSQLLHKRTSPSAQLIAHRAAHPGGLCLSPESATISKHDIDERIVTADLQTRAL